MSIFFFSFFLFFLWCKNAVGTYHSLVANHCVVTNIFVSQQFVSETKNTQTILKKTNISTYDSLTMFTFNSTHTRLQDKCHRLERTVDDLNTTVDDLNTTVNDLNTTVNDLSKKNADYRRKIQSFKATQKNLLSERNSVNASMDRLKQEHAKQIAKVTSVTDEQLAAAKAMHTSAVHQNKRLTQQLAEEQAKAKKEIETQRNKSVNSEKRRNECARAADRLAQEHQALKELYATLQKEMDMAKTELAKATAKVQSLEEENKKIDERMSAVLMLSRENQALHFRQTVETFAKKRLRDARDDAYAEKRRRTINDVE